MWQSGPFLPAGVQSDGAGGINVSGQIKSAYLVVQRYWDTAFPNDPLIDTSGGQLIISSQGSHPTIQILGQGHDPAIDIYNSTLGFEFSLAGAIGYDGTISMTKGVAANGHTAPDPPPTIAGSRTAMGIAVYAIIQSLAAVGLVIDGTTA